MPISTEDEIAPEDIVTLVSCNCNGECSNNHCTCKKNNVACTDFCGCGDSCQNTDMRPNFDDEDDLDDGETGISQDDEDEADGDELGEDEVEGEVIFCSNAGFPVGLYDRACYNKY